MERNREILSLLQTLTAIPSISDSDEEKRAADFIYEWITDIPYIKEHMEQAGTFAVPDDPHGRTVPYALVTGRSPETLVLMGHYDVVAVEDYGENAKDAFDCGLLPEILASRPISEEARADLESGEWLFGRGVCDMKGGLAAAMIYLKQYCGAEERPGTLLFLAVPDEESYSAGMRAACGLLAGLQERYGLSYELLIDPEPNDREAAEQIVTLGSAGKCMPVVLVQGVKAHIEKCFAGLNPMGIMGEIFSRTELSLEFADECDGELCVPPTWLWMKDRKQEYDVSIPLRMSGYLNMISFDTTPEEILAKLIPVCREAFAAYAEKLKRAAEEYRKRDKFASEYLENLPEYEPLVMTYEELTERIRAERPEEFMEFYGGLYEGIKEELDNGSLNYPQATIELMSRVLTFSGITEPLVLLGFAPPYYPAVRSDHVKNKRETSKRCLAAAEAVAKARFGYGFRLQNYALGITDTSYCCVDRLFDYETYAKNAPVWGELYHIDFDSIQKIDIPSVMLGPWGKDLHHMTERVQKKSVSEELPALIEAAAEELWNGNAKRSTAKAESGIR